MADRTITAADSTFAISCADLVIAATLIEGYAADAAFSIDAVDTAETTLGVDGKLSAGWIPRSYSQTVTLQADSPSRPLFDLIVGAQDANRTIYRLGGVITLPGNKYTFTFSRGVLKNYSVMPNAQKTLQPMPFIIEWETVYAIPIG
jgi:hypothetical protein